MILNIIEIFIFLFAFIMGLYLHRKLDRRIDKAVENKELQEKFRACHIRLVQAIILVSMMYLFGLAIWIYDYYIAMNYDTSLTEKLVWFVIESSAAITFLFALTVVSTSIKQMAVMKFQFKDRKTAVFCTIPNEFRHDEDFSEDKTLVCHSPGSKNGACESCTCPHRESHKKSLQCDQNKGTEAGTEAGTEWDGKSERRREERRMFPDRRGNIFLTEIVNIGDK